MLKSKKLYLRAMEKNDANKIVDMRNDPSVLKGLFSFKLTNVEQHLNWYKENVINDKRIDYMICLNETDEVIGIINFSDIDFKNQKAQFGILIASKQWGNGYAGEASNIFIAYGFNELNLKKIYLNVFNDNRRAINLYKSLGFSKEGLLKNEIFKNGEFKDILRMAIFRGNT